MGAGMLHGACRRSISSDIRQVSSAGGSGTRRRQVRFWVVSHQSKERRGWELSTLPAEEERNAGDWVASHQSKRRRRGWELSALAAEEVRNYGDWVVLHQSKERRRSWELSALPEEEKFMEARPHQV
ncbi:hypothetical protein E2C01_002690 [Portunus trituberculatus]|uniref:Uncharacterized protein n=1 Tax=Portunus trituberculatus TaxID=210409 RepID=A0A5B7CRF2_PORTR|nr:hypothetical protein [Portunus trituberculatus]